MFKDYFKKIRIKKEFLKEHKQFMHNYTKEGQKLEWDIRIYKDGEFDVYTGKQNGEYKVCVRQKSPVGRMIDDRVYWYNPETKTVEKGHGARWGM